MGQRRRKAFEQMSKKDQLIELPAGILSTIISSLSLKEAVQTSILSKRWRFIWTCHSILSFDSDNVLGSEVWSDNRSNNQTDSDIQLQTSMFVERVNHFMHRRSEGPKIDSLAIHFHLGKESTPHIDRWICFAVMKGVEKIHLDLSEWYGFKVNQTSSTTSEYYVFPCWFLAGQGRKCTVKHLHLASCSVSGHSSLNRLTSLTTIELREVNICDQELKKLLSNSSHLECLSLNLCKDLVNLNFSGVVSRLKFLNIKNCFRLQCIELYAGNLVTFEYTGHFISFSFRSVPKLAEAFLNFAGESRLEGVTYALTRFATDLPQLETLNVLSFLAMKTLKLQENGLKFTNIKQLVLTVFPFEDEDRLCWISFILKSFPLLRMLQLNLFSPSYIKQPKEIERHLPECPHVHLTQVEINGFYGNQHEVYLLEYLLNNLIALRDLVVSSCQKVYKAHKNWVYEEVSSRHKPRLDSVYKWLHAVVPPTVHLEVQ